MFLGWRGETAEASVRMVDISVETETGLDYFWMLFDDGQSQFDILLLVLSLCNFILKTQRFGSWFCFLLQVKEGPLERASLSRCFTLHCHQNKTCAQCGTLFLKFFVCAMIVANFEFPTVIRRPQMLLRHRFACQWYTQCPEWLIKQLSLNCSVWGWYSVVSEQSVRSGRAHLFWRMSYTAENTDSFLIVMNLYVIFVIIFRDVSQIVEWHQCRHYKWARQ